MGGKGSFHCDGGTFGNQNKPAKHGLSTHRGVLQGCRVSQRAYSFRSWVDWAWTRCGCWRGLPMLA
jgi:hypothetical protein